MIGDINNSGFSINQKGNLSLRGVDIVELSNLSSERPLYVIDEEQIRQNIDEYKQGLEKYYPGSSLICYASKALQNMGICQLMNQMNIGLDVCSYGEIFVANAVNFPPSKIIMHGNNKSELELKEAILCGIRYIIIDNEAEYTLINSICTQYDLTCSVLVRVNPVISVNTHKYIATGVKESKFGLEWNDRTISLIQNIDSNPKVDFGGLHSHIGSQISDPKEMINAAEQLIEYIDQLRKHEIACKALNIGGGIGIKYLPTDVMPNIGFFMKHVLEALVTGLKTKNLPLPFLLVEPGRSIVGNAGCTIYKVGSIKEGHDGILIASVNGGMTDNIRTALYQASYHAIVANNVDRGERKFRYKIVGKCCESGDVLIHEIFLPKLSEGDILTIFCTGAYNAALSSNFNKHTLPGMILISKGQSHWLVREQPIDDLLRYDIIPEHLQGEYKSERLLEQNA
jgi:diaminopimelate decarboxylase